MAAAAAAGSRTVDGLGGMGARLAWLRRELRSSAAPRPRPGAPAVAAAAAADASRPLLPQVMPAAWRLPRRVARAVMGDIREWVRSELSRAAVPDLPPAVVEVMVAAVQDVAAFEEELDRRFALEAAASGSTRPGRGAGGVVAGAAGAPAATVDGQPGGDTSGDVEALLAHCRDGTPLPGAGVSPSLARDAANGGPAAAAAAATSSPTAAAGRAPARADEDDLGGTFVGLVSGAFEPYLGAFVTVEASRLRRVVAASVRAESWAPAGAGGVAASATKLFLFIKKSLHTAAALSLRQPLFDLIQVFRAVLREYAGELVRHLPAQPAAGGGGGSGSGGGSAFSAGPLASTSAAALASSFSLVSMPSSSGSRSANKWREETGRACVIVATAEYCATTTEALGQLVARTVDAAFAPDVTVVPEMEAFHSAAAVGLRAAVAVTVGRLDAPLAAMRRTDWAAVDAVGDSSAYVGAAEAALRESAPALARRLSARHWRFVCERLTAAAAARLTRSLLSLPAVSSLGAQQLLLDVAAVKAALLDLPSAGEAGGGAQRGGDAPDAAATRYAKLVTVELRRPEALLKVVLAAADTTLDAYLALCGRGSAAEFGRLLEMKRAGRTQATELLAEYRRRVGDGADAAAGGLDRAEGGGKVAAAGGGGAGGAAAADGGRGGGSGSGSTPLWGSRSSSFMPDVSYATVLAARFGRSDSAAAAGSGGGGGAGGAGGAGGGVGGGGGRHRLVERFWGGRWRPGGPAAAAQPAQFARRLWRRRRWRRGHPRRRRW